MREFVALDFIAVSLTGSAGGCPAATHFLLLRQKKVSKEKATRSLSPYALLRARCGARSKWGQSQTRLAPQTRACPDPLCPALLASARTGGGAKYRVGCGCSPHPCPLPVGEGVKPELQSEAFLYPLSLWERVRVRETPNLSSFSPPRPGWA